MEGKLWKTSVLIVAALFVGCCQAFNDWHGFVYEEKRELEDLKEIIAGNRPKQLNARDETKMAGFLAEVKDKKSPLFNGVSPADLLALGLDETYDPEKTFCLAIAFKKFEATCEKVSENKFLDEYCIKNLERLRTICMSNKDWLYNRLVIDSLGFSLSDRPNSEILYTMAKRLIKYAVENQKTPLSPEDIVNEQKDSFTKFEENACVNYLDGLDGLFVIDKDGKNTYAYLRTENRFDDLFMGRYCAAILKRERTRP